ncbi:hypothetical protein AXX17_AT3G22760 [Arabidopsis thaliana]|uniref:Transmembrane protein n=1 Tax=Arabidopsis thaliana TaxID=3702 RepID=A0A178VE06_ARATH|nr:hypothetical protein AXX17_AT3G22760 [Arabidopsis thaliana]
MTWSHNLSGGEVNACLSLTSSRRQKILATHLVFGIIRIAAMLGTSSIWHSQKINHFRPCSSPSCHGQPQIS